MASLKSASTNIGKAVLVALGVPYGIAIVVNSVHGWPQSDLSHGRFTKQLTPSRVLSLNYALFQQMSMIKWFPLLLQANSVHRKADAALQNIPFGENGLKMDVWPPKKVPQREMPVVFFIYGGAWGSGYKEIYAKFGQEVAETLGAIVVIPDYRIYPKGNMADMVLDITESIHEFRAQKDKLKLSLNLDKIILIGHSAGAHLCAMTAIHIATKIQNIPVEIEIKDPDISGLKATTSKTQGVIVNKEDSSDVENNDLRADNKSDDGDQSKPFLGDSTDGDTSGALQRVDLAGSIKGVIGVGGVYHIMDHYQHEAKRGVEDLSPMWRAAEGLQNFEKHSPACLVPKLTEDQKRRLPPQMLIHGMNDSTVPEASSSLYAEVLAEAGVHTQLKVLAGAGHAELIMDMMEPSRKWYSVMMGAVMEGTGLFLEEA